MIDAVMELQSVVGGNAKAEVIQKYQDDIYFKKFLWYALNPLLSYHFSEKTLRALVRKSRVELVHFDNIFDCCDFLSRLHGVNEEISREVGTLLSLYDPRTQEIYIQLLAKTLRLGVTAKSVNKVIPGLIPEWEVQQAYPINKYPLDEDTEFWLTQKLNGVRATMYKGQLIARSGQVYEGLDHIIKAVGDRANDADLVLDGELILRDKGDLSDNEAFRMATGIINGDDLEAKRQIRYMIFDLIPLEDFESDTPSMLYSDRRVLLDHFGDILKLPNDAATIVPVLYHGEDQSMIWRLLDKMIAEDKEGLMVNTECPYRRTRHKGILKVKQFYSMDLPIIRCEEGSGRLKGTLGAFVLKFMNNEVKVGSGFSDEQRDIFWKNRDDLIGTLCEVKYKEVSADMMTGLRSLQFPVFVRLRDDKQEVSYG